MTTFLTLIISFIVLLVSANYLVRAASKIADHYQLSHFLTGITLVAFGTSLPEIMVAIYSSIAGFNDIGVGNAIGTNIANIGLVIGLTALIKPLRIHVLQINFEYPLLFFVMLIVYFLMLDGFFNVIDSCLFLLMLIGVVAYLFIRAKNALILTPNSYLIKQQILKKHDFLKQIVILTCALIILPFSAWYLVFASTQLGNLLGVSDLFIGLTVVAVGSSLPELATSIIAIKKGHEDLAIGNILGANIFNLLSVMIFPGLIHPAPISHAVLWRDIPVMFTITLLLGVFSYQNRKTRKLHRGHGALLILFYCCYLISLIISGNH